MTTMNKFLTKERITPAQATKYLNQNQGNRKLREGYVERLAEDMRRGNWTECMAPIVFYEDGTIADGQHRLWAIVESETAQEFYIGHNLTRASGLNLDTGMGRSLIDNARISGADLSLSHQLVSAAMFYEKGERPSKGSSPAMKIASVQKFRAPIEWAISHGPVGKGFRNSAVLCAIARAYAAGENPDRLMMFSKVMASGFGEGKEDSAAIAMRNYIMTRKAVIANAEYHEFFLKLQNAIWYFIRRRSLNVIRNIDTEAYPLKKKKS